MFLNKTFHPDLLVKYCLDLYINAKLIKIFATYQKLKKKTREICAHQGGFCSLYNVCFHVYFEKSANATCMKYLKYKKQYHFLTKMVSINVIFLQFLSAWLDNLDLFEDNICGSSSTTILSKLTLKTGFFFDE